MDEKKTQQEIPETDIQQPEPTQPQGPKVDWLEGELDNIQASMPGGTYPEALKLEEKKITKIKVDFSVPFQTWKDPTKETIKALIPCEHEGVKKTWWLNKRNPVYHEIVKRGKEGIDTFQVMKMGSQQNTRYEVVE